MAHRLFDATRPLCRARAFGSNLRFMRRLLLAPLAVLLVVGAGGSASAAVRSNREVAHCLDYYAHVSRVAVPRAHGLIGPMVRAWFRDGTEVRAWFYASAAAARAARPVGTFNWNATRKNVAYVWNQKPKLRHRIQLKFCITPPSAMPGHPVTSVPAVVVSTTTHAAVVTRGGHAAVKTKP